MQSKKINLQGVGEILLERSNRAKYINLSVKPFKGARIAVPMHVSFQEAETVAQSKAQWLKDHMGRMAAIERRILDSKSVPAINRAQARHFLVQRLAHLAALHGFSYNKVFVRNQRTRWGSCSSKNNINLNLHLMQLPAELIDYTLLHELVHTRIKNHGPHFWAELGKYIPDPKKPDQELNEYWILLIAE